VSEPLKFIVAPHIVQDLGLNLYTSLPRVLVEFVANAYDADATAAKISLDREEIQRQRKIVKGQWELEKLQNPGQEVVPLEERALPSCVQIVVEDDGHGMSRDDLQRRFLVAGRRRRSEDGNYSFSRRFLMGRKGLGKLAGFGVAHRIDVTSRRQGDSHATQITLDYKELVTKRDTNEVVIPDAALMDGGGIAGHGTRIVLSELLYEPMKTRLNTVSNHIGDHFSLIDVEDFKVTLNENVVTPTERGLVYGWPEPDRPPSDLVDASYSTEDGRHVQFSYRIRFCEKSLQARERGVRVYAHKRLAAAPDLLDLQTGMHGFRNTEYLDGVVHADIIDEQTTDYISTDRQSLRWETALLAPMREMLSAEMKEACRKYQAKRDKESDDKAKENEFTNETIEASRLPKHRKKFAYRIAGMLTSVCQGGVEGDEYRRQLPIFVDGLSQGAIFRDLAELAAKQTPELDHLVARVTELTATEFGDFARFVQGRLDGIQALKRICESVDFKEKENEAELQELFSKSPWLIDPTFSQFLTADQSMNVLFGKLAEVLGIGKYASGKDDEKRPDLVFLLGSEGLARLVVVELKSSNKPFDGKDLRQLQGYIRRSKQWLSKHTDKTMKIDGYLIGSEALPDSKAEDVLWLRDQVEKGDPAGEWSVYDVMQVLERTNDAHRELLDIYEKAAARDSD